MFAVSRAGVRVQMSDAIFFEKGRELALTPAQG